MTSRMRPRRRLATKAPATIPVDAISERFLRRVPHSRTLTGRPALGQVDQDSGVSWVDSVCSLARTDGDSETGILSQIHRFGNISRSRQLYELISGYNPRRTMKLGKL